MLAHFACSRGEWFADEVQQFARHDLLVWQGDPAWGAFDRRALGIFQDDELVAIVAHQVLTELSWDNGTPVEGTFLAAVAIASAYQGSHFGPPTRAKSSEYVRRALRGDIRRRRRGPFVAGKVAADNTRSLRMCTTWNLRDEVASTDLRYVWRIGVLR